MTDLSCTAVNVDPGPSHIQSTSEQSKDFTNNISNGAANLSHDSQVLEKSPNSSILSGSETGTPTKPEGAFTSSSIGSCSNIRHFKKALIYSSTNFLSKPEETVTSEDKLVAAVTPEVSDSVTPVNLKIEPTDLAVKTESETTVAETIVKPAVDEIANPSTSAEVAKESYDVEDVSKYSANTQANKSEVEPMQVEEDVLTKEEDKELDTSSDISAPSTSSGNILLPHSNLPVMPQMVTHVGRKPLNGPPCSLKTLVDDNILDPLDGSLTYEILGSKFFGDLLPNGFIRLSGTSQVFANPSSWANYCRSTIPSCSKDQKNYGSAWSIIRYLGKRLDSYKLRWYRKQKKQYMGNGSTATTSTVTNPAMLLKNSKSHMDNILPNYSGVFNFPLNANFPNMAAYNQFPINQMPTMPRTELEFKNIVTMMNRDRLYKLDKISAGDPELNVEKFESENVLNFNSIDLNEKDIDLDDKTKVSCVPFNSVYCLQPFIVTISTNVLLLIDFHSHLISSEVSGYLAGSWDPRTQHLTITQAYPLRIKPSVDSQSQLLKIKQSIVHKNLILVGWYHSHPNSIPCPSIGDIKKQLKYQKQMLADNKGLMDYTPCVGLIAAPFYQRTSKLSTLFQMFWVMPVFTSKNCDLGRPMQISYNVTRDAFLTQDLLVEMRMLATYFSTNEKFVKFNEIFRQDSSYWEKLQESLKPKLPKDLIETHTQSVQNDIQQQALMHFWSFLKNLLLIS